MTWRGLMVINRWSLSPKFGLRNKSVDLAGNVDRELVEVFNRTPTEGFACGMTGGPLFGMDSMWSEIGSQGYHKALRLTHPALTAPAAIEATAPFGSVSDAGLKQLIRREPEEVRNAIEIV